MMCMICMLEVTSAVAVVHVAGAPPLPLDRAPLLDVCVYDSVRSAVMTSTCFKVEVAAFCLGLIIKPKQKG